MPSFNVFQIFYDEPTRLGIDPGFLPLDNTANLRPDWYELWVIRNYLHAKSPTDGDWYGFLSPHFFQKTGFRSADVFHFLEAVSGRCDVALLLYSWDQVAYFRNPFEQGEFWHPGITTLSQSVLAEIGVRNDLGLLVSHSGTFTFSNYVVAKAAYWRAWLTLADALFDHVEGTSDGAMAARANTTYGSPQRLAPMKAFIQERLPAILLADRTFRTSTLDPSATCPIFDRLFEVGPQTRGLLQTCDFLKRRYRDTGESRFLELFWDIRSLITLKPAARPDATAAHWSG